MNLVKKHQFKREKKKKKTRKVEKRFFKKHINADQIDENQRKTILK